MKNKYLLIICLLFSSASLFSQYTVQVSITSVSVSFSSVTNCDLDGGFSGNSDFQWDVDVDDNRGYSENFSHEEGGDNNPGTISSGFDNSLNFNKSYNNGDGGNPTCPPTFLIVELDGKEDDGVFSDAVASNTFNLVVPNTAGSSTSTQSISVNNGTCGTVTYTFNFSLTTSGTPHFECADEPCDATTQIIQDPCDATLNYSEYDVSTSSSTFSAASTSCGIDGSNDIFFKFTAPVSGAITVYVDDWGDFGAATTTDNTGGIYTGTCGSLSIASGLTIEGSQGSHNEDCIDFSSGVFNGTNEGPFNISGLTPGNDYFIRVTEEDDQNSWLGLAFAETLLENDCINAEPLSGSGCNYNADDNNEPDDNSWTGQAHLDADVNTIPGVDDIDNCNSDWFSNENMVWYYFDIDASTTQPVSITVENINCNNSGGGTLQMGIWRKNGASCASAGGASSSNGLGAMVPVGCNVGTSGSLNVTLPSAMAFDRYYLVMDGNAGAECVWEFESVQVLPVEMLSFTAEAKDNKAITLDWSTATEINNSGFELERSTDGISFERIDFVEGNGNTSEKIDYTFLDANVLSGTYYYRLKQIDFDGKYQYSDIRNANIINKEMITVSNFSPNPTNNKTNLNFVSFANARVRVLIFDNLGRKMLDKFENITEGNHSVSINTSDFSIGIYTAKILVDKQEFTRRLVVNK